MAVISLSETKIFLQIPAQDSSKDSQIGNLIEYTEAWFERYTNRIITPKPQVALFNGTGSSSIVLKLKPINSIVCLEILDCINNVICVYSQGNLRFDPDSGVIRLIPTPSMYSATSLPISIIIPQGILNVRVTYTAGYVTCPPDIKLMLMRLVAFWMDPTTTGMATKKRFGDIEFDARVKKDLPADLLLQLDGYRRILI